MADMGDTPEPVHEPANLKFLRRLVTVLTAVMICGVVLVIALLVIRLNGPAPLPLPAHITLPENARPTAFTRGPDWIAVVSEDNRILIFDIESGALTQELQITR